MDFFDLLESRRSVRAFTEKPVEETDLRRILDAANRAPSAGNLQAYEIYVVRRPEDRRALAQASLGQLHLASAPVALVFCQHPERSIPRYGARGERLYAPQDATIACTCAMLAAHALGLATVWVGAFGDEDVRRVIGAPAGIRPVAILPIGYAAENPPVAPRRSLADLVHEL